jgi:hypothetical protein
MGELTIRQAQACSKAPAEAAATIAEVLVYFGSDSEPSTRLWNEPGALIRVDCTLWVYSVLERRPT